MTKFIFIRHGQSETNLENVFAGNCNPDLTETGMKQAEKTAEYIVQNYKVDAIYSSDLTRAYKTASAVAKLTGKNIIKSEKLREIDGGIWNGMKYTEIEKIYPDELNTFRNDIGNSVCTGGESVKHLAKRVTDELHKIALENPDKTVVIASHATPIRAMQCVWSGHDVEAMCDIPWATNASVTVADYDGKKAVFEKISYDEHLSGMITKIEGV